jgi:hypothetical protein
LHYSVFRKEGLSSLERGLDRLIARLVKRNLL